MKFPCIPWGSRGLKLRNALKFCLPKAQGPHDDLIKIWKTVILFNLLLQMSLPPLFSENKKASEKLGQLEFKSLQGLTSSLKHKFVEGRLMQKFLFWFVFCF